MQVGNHYQLIRLQHLWHRDKDLRRIFPENLGYFRPLLHKPPQTWHFLTLKLHNPSVILMIPSRLLQGQQLIMSNLSHRCLPIHFRNLLYLAWVLSYNINHLPTQIFQILLWQALKQVCYVISCSYFYDFGWQLTMMNTYGKSIYRDIKLIWLIEQCFSFP